MIKPAYQHIRVLIADDQELIRAGFQTLLRRQPEIEFVGEAENGRELLELAATLKPDIIFMDIKMPLLDGIEATRILSGRQPETGIIALTLYDDDNLIVDMLEAGAKGYLVKNAAKQEIIDAIHTVYESGNYYCRHTNSKLTQLIAKSKFNPHKKNKTVEFTQREKEVIDLICREFSNKEIAAKMGLSVRTIEGYRERIQEKMEVHSTAGLVVYAIKKGLFK
jgi:DNA-binding NarL/FixJ family response regulator